MVSLGHPSFPPTDRGRQDDEEASPGRRPLYWRVTALFQVHLNFPNPKIRVGSGLRSTYGNRPQRNQINQGFENRNRYNRNDQGFENRNRIYRDDHGFESLEGRYQFRNKGSSDNFNRYSRNGGTRGKKLLSDLYEGAEGNPPIILSGLCMSLVEIPHVPILLNETLTKALWDTGAKKKSFISEEVYKIFFYKPFKKSRAEVVMEQVKIKGWLSYESE
ncbi:hypothetical protein TNCV_4134871 [Trichonephila clavipes]|nr:hypothetical protein TNCV_4134871 [Trichonephila clavipes]